MAFSFINDIRGRKFYAYDVMIVAESGKDLKIDDPTSKAIYYDFSPIKLNVESFEFVDGGETLDASIPLFNYPDCHIDVHVKKDNAKRLFDKTFMVVLEDGSSNIESNLPELTKFTREPIVNGSLIIDKHAELYEYFINNSELRECIEGTNTGFLRYIFIYEDKSNLSDKVFNKDLYEMIQLSLDSSLAVNIEDPNYIRFYNTLSLLLHNSEFRTRIGYEEIA